MSFISDNLLYQKCGFAGCLNSLPYLNQKCLVVFLNQFYQHEENAYTAQPNADSQNRKIKTNSEKSKGFEPNPQNPSLKLGMLSMAMLSISKLGKNGNMEKAEAGPSDLGEV